MISLSPEPIDAAALQAGFLAGLGDAGAAVSFTGIVRGEGARNVEALYLDHAPPLTGPAIEKALETAAAKWPLIKTLIVHRIGRVEVGAPIVFVATAAAHRRAAFEACEFLMDFLKTDAPFWKKQICRGGEEWIEPRSEDYADRERWR
ncbi:MAG: molybdenum cofactor biosynthesis protein MoaE [Parvularculaceae bacterium]|nr:molybdenum cofactor biosynthesis protein MoaE [Parvularculaceae bacterium]